MTGPSIVPALPEPGERRGTIARRRLLGMAGMTLAGGVAVRTAFAQAQPSPGHGLLATPAASSSGPAALHELLSLVPLEIREAGSDGGIAWQLADLASQFAALGIDQEVTGSDLPDGFLNALHPLAIGSPAFSYAMDPAFLDAIGFQPLATERTLWAGGGTSRVTLFQGGIALEEVPATWAASGYDEAAASDGTPFWTLGEDGALDLEHPIQRRVIANFNNAAILEETLVYASERALLEAVIVAWRAGGASLADDPAIAPAVATMPANTVSAVGLDPAGMGPVAFVLEDAASRVEADFDASDAAVGPMPAATGMIFGITEGFTVLPPDDGDGTPTTALATSEAVVAVRIATASAEDAARVARVVEYRWSQWSSLATGQSFTELMSLRATTATGNVAELTFDQPRSPRVWFELIVRGDVLPFMPRP